MAHHGSPLRKCTPRLALPGCPNAAKVAVRIQRPHPPASELHSTHLQPLLVIKCLIKDVASTSAWLMGTALLSSGWSRRAITSLVGGGEHAVIGQTFSHPQLLINPIKSKRFPQMEMGLPHTSLLQTLRQSQLTRMSLRDH